MNSCNIHSGCMFQKNLTGAQSRSNHRCSKSKPDHTRSWWGAEVHNLWRLFLESYFSTNIKVLVNQNMARNAEVTWFSVDQNPESHPPVVSLLPTDREICIAAIFLSFCDCRVLLPYLPACYHNNHSNFMPFDILILSNLVTNGYSYYCRGLHTRATRPPIEHEDRRWAGKRLKCLTQKGAAEGTGSTKSTLNVSKSDVDFKWEATKPGPIPRLCCRNSFIRASACFTLQLPIRGCHEVCFPSGLRQSRCAFLPHLGSSAAMLPQEPQARRTSSKEEKPLWTGETMLARLCQTKDWTSRTIKAIKTSPSPVKEAQQSCLLQHEDSRAL